MVKGLFFLLMSTCWAYSQTIPGDTNPAVTQDNIQQTICHSGYAKSVRPPVSYTNALKRQLGCPVGSIKLCELDHLIPLEVGGNPTSHDNLWMQPWHNHCNAKQKDKLENKIHQLVCSGRLTLIQGQSEFSDWEDSYKEYINPRGC